jgi:DNA repair exonuclease SbcCD ATPase subunit
MKRVNFKKITIQNFLSVGEEPVTVEFKKGLHVITGLNRDKPDRRNAIGKSTIADSVYFAIFGETLREIKKDLIPNNITSGRTHVELEFEVITTSESNNYTVIRTLSPTKTLIFENGIDKTRDSIANTTKYICDVLSASPAIFKNCVIMTVNNAIPFMAKNKSEKRKFIEDIFGLEVFSDMISLLRSEYNEIKRNHDTHQTAVTEIDRTYNSYLLQRDNTIQKRREKKQLYLQRKENNINEKNELLTLIESIQSDDVKSLEADINSYEKGVEKCDQKITEITADIAVGKQQINSLKETYSKIGTDQEKCPVCLREIKDHDANYIIQEKNTLKVNIEKEAENIKQKLTHLEDINKKKTTLKQRINELHNKVNQSKLNEQNKYNKLEKVAQLEKWITDLEEDLCAVENEKTDFDTFIEETKRRLETVTTDTEALRVRMSELDIVKYIVSEEGVKSYIVNKLLELLNSRLLHYLQKLDSSSICIFNEYFEEEILNEKNKVCSYFNFSGAERKTIDLACLFTFSDLRRMQGGVQYNITMYDELFDSSFDEKGIELITNILRERVDELHECSVVISHRKESIKAVTGDVIYLEKENGITRRLQYKEI